MKENAAARFGVVLVEPIAADVDGSRVRLDDLLAVGVNFRRGDQLDFPAGFDLDFQFFPAIPYDLADGLLQISLARSDQQHIIHVPQVMPDEVRPLAAAGFV